MIKTLTFSLNTFFQPSDSDVMELLQANIENAVILSVDRGLFSSRFEVTFTPDSDAMHFTDLQWSELFMNAASEDYTPEVIAVENGAGSSVPGGLDQAFSESVETVTQPILYLAVAAVAIAAVVITIKFK